MTFCFVLIVFHYMFIFYISGLLGYHQMFRPVCLLCESFIQRRYRKFFAKLLRRTIYPDSNNVSFYSQSFSFLDQSY